MVALNPWPEADPSLMTPAPEHDDIRRVVRDIFDKHSDHDAVRRVVETPAGHDEDLWGILCAHMDVASMALAEDRGGLGYGLPEQGVVLEEAGRALSPEPLLSSAVLAVHAISQVPRTAATDDLLSAVAGGGVLAALGPLDPVASLTATPRAEDWSVSGTVERVLHGATADILLLVAATPVGLGLFTVRADQPGLTVRPHAVMDTTRRQARLELHDARAHRLLDGPDLPRLLVELRDLTTIAVACEHVGMMDALLSMTKQHLVQREQFGRPLATFQALKHRMADLLVDLERARSSARYAARVFVADPSSVPLAAAVAGAVCTDAVVRAAHEAIQLHGGIGFTWEHPAHLYLRRALGDEALFGDGRAHRAAVADLIDI